MIRRVILSLVFSMVFTPYAYAQNLSLKSDDIEEGQTLSNNHVFQGFGCEGGDKSPQLSWSGAPTGTKSFAITAYDPDAPTGSGWWHWNVINIPASTQSIPHNYSQSDKITEQIVELKNDYGSVGFGGACPPRGEVHRYVFTVHALSLDKLEIPSDSSNALAGFMINSNTIESASITAVYTRK